MGNDDDQPPPTLRPSAAVSMGRKEDSDQKMWRLLFGLVGVIIAFLLIFVASRYFSTHGPESVVPDQTIFTTPFPNSADATVTADGVVRLPLVNQAASAITITDDANDHALGDCAGGALRSVNVSGSPLRAPPVTVKVGQAFILEFQCSSKAVGELFSSEAGFAYRSERSGLVRSYSGTLVATVR